MNINIQFKDTKEPILFENLEGVDINNDNKFLYFSAGSVEWYVLHKNIEWFSINYKERDNA